MDAAVKDYGFKRKEAETKDLPRSNATFTELFELIFYNKSMARSELEVLLQLVEKKLKEKVATTPAIGNDDAHKAYRKQAIYGRI